MSNVTNPIERGSKIKTILKLYSEGKTIEEIIALGFHKSTVKIQISKLLKEKKGEK